MTINGTMTIGTYFILNKRDRSGKGQPRPFQVVLDGMKRQETEEAKLKQSNSLKGGPTPAGAPLPPPPSAVASAPAPAPAPAPPKENGFIQAPPEPTINYTSAEHTAISAPLKSIKIDETSIPTFVQPKLADEQQIRSSEMLNSQQDATKSYNRQLARSRACILI